MSANIIYNNCPACHRDAIAFQLKAKDFTVSGEVFEIWECDNCGLRFTQHIPSANSIGAYYRSENYISHSNTSKGLVNRLYHSVRAITLRQKARLLRNTTGLSTGTLLDIGAGTGAFAAFMRSEGWRVTALEPDESARSVAREQNNICLLSLNEFFSLPEASFDAITMWHVLEHVHALHEYMEQLKKLLSTNGRAFIAVPNYTSYDAAFYKEYWAAYDVPRHLYHFSPKAMKILVESHGLKLAGIRPMWFDSFYVSLLSEKYRTGKQNLLRGAWTGLLSNIKAIRNKENCSSLIYIISA
jgi:2-polyprenyl-3-methyl-5-hydroxy-6-metoxy-1,4-benzoquinol methylase